MEKYLLLDARKENWGLSCHGEWGSISWKVYSDSSYKIKIGFIPEQDEDDFIQKTGKMSKDSFTSLYEAISQDWSSKVVGCACDGEAWELIQYSPDGNIVKSNGKLDYIYGQEALERITELLPGKVFVLDNPYKMEQNNDCSPSTKQATVSSLKEADGFTEKRSFKKGKDGRVNLEITYELSLIPFAMDESKESFIIFMNKREKELSLFIWVFLDEEDPRKRIRVTAINDLMIYSKFTDEGMDISGKYPEDIIRYALTALNELSTDEFKEAVQTMYEKMSQIGGYDRWSVIEEDLLDQIRAAKRNNKVLFLMY